MIMIPLSKFSLASFLSQHQLWQLCAMFRIDRQIVILLVIIGLILCVSLVMGGILYE